jgi:hypothetical protein
MAIVWLVTVGDQERNFRRKSDAVAWLVRLTHDERPVPAVHREHPWLYSYYGGRGDLLFVTRAWIQKLGFPSVRFYVPRPGRKKRSVEPPSTTAVDPSAADPGTPTPRDANGVSS